jgi:hypothetical protein
VAGAANYEFRMQIRRKALWVTLLVFAAFQFGGGLAPWRLAELEPDTGVVQVVAGWSLYAQLLLPLAFGILLTDRLPRDGRTGAGELLDTTPASPGGRFFGKYLGASLATLTPVFLFYTVGVAYIALQWGSLAALPLGVAAFLGVNLPGLLFMAALSICGPAFMPVLLYQFLFFGFWIWASLIPSNNGLVPGLGDTILSPVGGYMANGFFGSANRYAVSASLLEGIASLVLLVALGALVLWVTAGYRTWKRIRA